MVVDVQKMSESEYEAYIKAKNAGEITADQLDHMAYNEVQREIGGPTLPGVRITEPTPKGTPDPNQSYKLDEGKLRYDLLPPLAMDELVRVYTFGVQKYAARNWEKGLPWTKWFAAIMRHVMDWLKGENLDPESGIHHMAHAAWNCLALTEYYLRKTGQDDRPYSVPPDMRAGVERKQ
jgi:hypothetical protein